MSWQQINSNGKSLIKYMVKSLNYVYLLQKLIGWTFQAIIFIHF